LHNRPGHIPGLHQQGLQKQPFPIKQDAFDAITCVGILTYIEDPYLLFEEFCRIVRPGGHIVFTHRKDFMKPHGFPEILEALEDKGHWKNLLTSEPEPYLPNNESFADEVKVIYFIFQTAGFKN
jgi:SAM-dependent methyltransferase